MASSTTFVKPTRLYRTTSAITHSFSFTVCKQQQQQQQQQPLVSVMQVAPARVSLACTGLAHMLLQTPPNQPTQLTRLIVADCGCKFGFRPNFWPHNASAATTQSSVAAVLQLHVARSVRSMPRLATMGGLILTTSSPAVCNHWTC
jgi:hypothetical protein